MDRKLFCTMELGEFLQNERAKALGAIAKLDSSQFEEQEKEDKLTESFWKQFSIKPLVLRRDDISMIGPDEVELTLSDRQALRIGYARGGKFRGARVTFVIPFEGDSRLFECLPNSFTSIFPSGEIKGQEYQITLEYPVLDTERVKKDRDWHINLVQEYIRYQESQIKGYNDEIVGVVRQAIDRRRNEMKSMEEFTAAFDIPKQTTEPKQHPQTASKPPLARKGSQEKPSIFICYVKQDESRAREVFDELEAAGASPWLDSCKLVLGDNWEHEIKKAVSEADAFVACLRPGFDEIGFRQKEVRWALDALQLRPPGKGFIIPFIIAPCELPDWCKPIHAGSDLSRPTTIEELIRAVEKHCGWTRIS